MSRPSLDELRMLFGFLVLLIIAVLTGVIAIGHVEESTSYGLIPIITVLATVGGGFAQWAFGAGGNKGNDPEEKK